MTGLPRFDAPTQDRVGHVAPTGQQSMCQAARPATAERLVGMRPALRGAPAHAAPRHAACSPARRPRDDRIETCEAQEEISR